MKTALPPDAPTSPSKKARPGVGSSVAPLLRHATDDLLLLLLKTRAERLLPKGRKIFVCDRLERLPVAFEVRSPLYSPRPVSFMN